MVILCDLDGTVADNSHRQGFLQAGKKDWDSFYNPDLIWADEPIEKALEVLPKLIIKTMPNFFFLTGRPERTRQVTDAWIEKHVGVKTRMPGPVQPAPISDAHRPQLVMRKDGDHRAANVYKEDLCRFLYDHARPILFIDDDERNQAMYSRYGIFLKAPDCWEVFR
jgi:hypothetical protein